MKRRQRSGPEQAQRVMRKLATNPLKQVMFGVEAEADGHGGAVLTLVDINERRNLYHKYGEHNVRVSMQDMIGLGFPRRALAVMQKGYPVRVGMPLETYEGLITSGGFSGLEGRYDEDEDEDEDLDAWSCSMCGGPVIPMGALGGRLHGRCRNCGMMVSRVVGEDEELEGLGAATPHRPIAIIAREVASDWKKPYFGAVPYLQAMRSLNSIHDNYGLDSAREIVIYFLANANTWRGQKAREIKAELKAMLEEVL